MSKWTYLTGEEIDRLVRDASLRAMERIMNADSEEPHAVRLAALKGVLLLKQLLSEEISDDHTTEETEDSKEMKGATENAHHA